MEPAGHHDGVEVADRSARPIVERAFSLGFQPATTAFGPARSYCRLPRHARSIAGIAGWKPALHIMTTALPFPAARTPRTLWVELTSKCPFDCVFCSRQLRRGAGQHLPFAVYSSLLDSLVDPRKFILNYSGESTVYPDLIAAIEQARSTGAFVELVSVMATAPESLLGPSSRSGLNRLTVSVHATDNEKFAEVYRHSSFDTLRSRLERFMELCRAEPRPPVVDLAFVAMETNLAQLPSVTSFAKRLGLRDIMIFPVMRRDEIPAQFPSELTVLGAHRPDFKQRVRATVNAAAEVHPQIRFTICNESFNPGASPLGEVPVPYPQDLPPGAYIHSCEQNPWETAHVLSNGDVVACEVLDKIPLGNAGAIDRGDLARRPVPGFSPAVPARRSGGMPHVSLEEGLSPWPAEERDPGVARAERTIALWMARAFR